MSQFAASSSNTMKKQMHGRAQNQVNPVVQHNFDPEPHQNAMSQSSMNFNNRTQNS